MSEQEEYDVEDWIEAVTTPLGAVTSARRDRLEELFAENHNPDPLTLYQAWQGSDPLTREEANARSVATSNQAFDPKTDQPRSSTKVLVKSAYDDAIDAGFEEAAEYLRNLNSSSQKEFKRLLEFHYLEADLLDRVKAQAEAGDSREIKQLDL